MEWRRRLEALLSAETLDEYAGPVLFTDYAAAQFIAQLFAAQLTPAKSPLLAEDWMKQYMPDAKLAGKLNRRVLPEFVTVTDEPTRESWEGMKLAGYKLVDDEGVPAEDVTLVENGRLVTLPTGRGPTKKLTESNGHAVTFPNLWTEPTASNLFVRSEKTKKDLVEELRKLAKDCRQRVRDPHHSAGRAGDLAAVPVDRELRRAGRGAAHGPGRGLQGVRGRRAHGACSRHHVR